MLKWFGTPWQAGDVVIRQKKTGNGFHYGRLVRTVNVLPFMTLHWFYPEFLVSHTTPEGGQRFDILGEFAAGLPWQVVPKYLNPWEQLEVERRAVEGRGKPYNPLAANCEDHALGHSPTREGWLLLVGLIAVGMWASNQAQDR